MAASVPGYHGPSSSTGSFLPGSSRLTAKELLFFEETLSGPFEDQGDSRFSADGSIGPIRSGAQSAEEGINREIRKIEDNFSLETYPLDTALMMLEDTLNKIVHYSKNYKQQAGYIDEIAFCLENLSKAAPAVQTVMENTGAAVKIDFLRKLSQPPKALPETPFAFQGQMKKYDIQQPKGLYDCISACYIAFTHEFVSALTTYKGIKASEKDAHLAVFTEQKRRLLAGPSFDPLDQPSRQTDKEVLAQTAISEAIYSLERHVQSGRGEQGMGFADTCTRSYQQIPWLDGSKAVNTVFIKYEEILTRHLHWYNDGKSDWGKRMFLAPATAIPGGPDVQHMIKLRLVAMKWAMQMPASLP